MPNRVTLPIEGMTCERCVAHVREALERVAGVIAADVSLAERRAVVELVGDPAPQTDGAVERLAEAVAGAGYRAGPFVPTAPAPVQENPNGAAVAAAVPQLIQLALPETVGQEAEARAGEMQPAGALANGRSPGLGAA